VSIGEVLADARCRSGLSINEVSRQTRIREAVIWGIELDNYALCGGDFYARGHIRAIAQVVGIDSVPLIEEFDARRREQEARRQAEVDNLRTSMLLAPRPSHATNSATPSNSSSSSSSANLPDRPAAPGRPGRPGPGRSQRYRRRHRRRVVLSTALCLVVLAIFGVEAYHFGQDMRPASENTAQAAFNRSTASQHAKPAASKSASKSTPKPSPSPTHATAPAVETLKPVSATAYGPYGVQGDNPQDASKAIDIHGRTAWTSDWYSTAEFGNTQTGTGLLLDLGHNVTINSALIVVGAPGATIQLRAGTSKSDLAIIGGAKNASSTTTIRPEQIRVRYLLIWFTALPPDSDGTYQAAVYNVDLQGQP
jgi:cytoskeletal protein RodZ